MTIDFTKFNQIN